MKKILSFLFFLFFSSNCFAVTEFIAVINKSTQDYDTLTIAEAALDDAGNLTDGTVKCGAWDNLTVGNIADGASVTWDAGSSTGTMIHMSNGNGGSGGDQYLIDVTAGTLADNDVVSDGTNTIDVNGAPDSCIVVLELYNDDGEIDDGPITIDGFTTDATNYVKITAPSAERHDGTAGTGVIINPSANLTNGQSVIYLNDAYTVLEWVEIKNWTVSFSKPGFGIRMGDNLNTIARNNIVHDGNTTDNVGISVFTNSTVVNNIVYDVACSGISAPNSFDTGMEILNNTVYDYNGDNTADCNGISQAGSSSTGNIKNNLVIQGSTTSATDYSITSLTTATNGSSDTSGTTGLQNLTTSEFVSVTGGSEDLHLASGSTSEDAGTDLGTTPSGVNIDIDGRDRDAEGDTWDLGADEFVAAGGGGARRIWRLIL